MVTGGAFTLQFNGAATPPINYNINPTIAQNAIQNALDALPTIGESSNGLNAVVSAFSQTSYTVTFQGGMAGFSEPLMIANGSRLLGDGETSIAVATTTVGHKPKTAAPNTAFAFQVTAVDPYGNIVYGSNDTVHFSSSDAHAVLPADTTLTNGVGTFMATLETEGSQTITVTDTSVSPNPAGASTFYVQGIPVLGFAISASSAVAGTSETYTVTALGQNSRSPPAMPALSISAPRTVWQTSRPRCR